METEGSNAKQFYDSLTRNKNQKVRKVKATDISDYNFNSNMYLMGEN